jgi:membrane fusion protein (multidrug efflux system)
MKRKTLIYLFAIAGLIYSCNSNGTQTVPVNTTPVQLPVYSVSEQDAYTWQEFPVTLEGRSDVEIRSQVDGYLQKIFVDEGAYVSEGQVIFKIEEQRYREALNEAEGVLTAADAALINAKLEVEKISPLVRDSIVSAYQLKSAQAALNIAIANKKQAEAAVSAAKINIGYTNITAPVSGYITRLPKKQGSFIAMADPQPLTTLSDNAEIRAYFSMSESDFFSFDKKHQGNTVNEKIKNLPLLTLILSDNTEYEQKGYIDMIDGKVNNTTGAITLRASFPNTKGLLRSGNTGRVRLDIDHNDVIVIPQAATVEVQDRVFVYTVDQNNKVTKQPIKVSGKSGTAYLVSDGLKSGDRIVYKGFENLQEGTVIVPEKLETKISFSNR